MWTTPKTDWQINEVVDAADLNAIGENLAALKSPAFAQVVLDEPADFTTTATSFVDVSTARLSLTIDTQGGDVLVAFVGSVYSTSTAVINVSFDVAVDGVRAAGEEGLLVSTVNSNFAANASFNCWITNLSAGSHTFKLQWKLSAGSAIMWAGAVPLHPRFSVREVS